jgi:hypothetical protein
MLEVDPGDAEIDDPLLLARCQRPGDINEAAVTGEALDQSLPVQLRQYGAQPVRDVADVVQHARIGGQRRHRQ